MKSILIFNALTCVDHSVVSSSGTIVGGSFLLSVILTSTLDQDAEKIDISSLDFNALKNKIENCVNHSEQGFGNKLWICSDSNSNVKSNKRGVSIVATPELELETPEKFLRLVSAKYSDIAAIESKFNSYLEYALNDDTQNPVKFKVDCKLTTKPVGLPCNTGLVSFRYSHGLPSSTNSEYHSIVGGHLSYFILLDSDYQPLPLENLRHQEFSEKLTELSFEFDSTYFANSNHAKISLEDSVAKTEIKYTTEAGYFSLKFKGTSKFVFLSNKDATVENICEYMKPKFAIFKNAGAKYLMVSEGLLKGAVAEL